MKMLSYGAATHKCAAMARGILELLHEHIDLSGLVLPSERTLMRWRLQLAPIGWTQAAVELAEHAIPGAALLATGDHGSAKSKHCLVLHLAYVDRHTFATVMQRLGALRLPQGKTAKV